VSILIDASTYFAAVRSALKQARRSVFIIGWDLDSRTQLVGSDCEANDGWPADLGDFLTRLARERTHLTVHLLAWDYAVLYALEREPFPSLKLGWNTPSRVRFRLDNALPVGASHHQKIVVIDDAVAFSGGLDLTIRRWDTNHHRIDDPRRLDPAGKPTGTQLARSPSLHVSAGRAPPAKASHACQSDRLGQRASRRISPMPRSR
jgi:phosphatidylserine/phosphatidylglycerophosphate/cardiolipin synthase-like enzyme